MSALPAELAFIRTIEWGKPDSINSDGLRVYTVDVPRQTARPRACNLTCREPRDMLLVRETTHYGNTENRYRE